MLEAFKAYFHQIKNLDVKDATEHTLRPALDHLLKALAGEKIKVIHEPKRDETGKGAPDFKFKTNECILGYLENKKITENLDQILKSDQIAKYRQLSGQSDPDQLPGMDLVEGWRHRQARNPVLSKRCRLSQGPP